MRRKSIKGAHFFRDSCVLSFCGLKEKRVSFPFLFFLSSFSFPLFPFLFFLSFSFPLSRLREEYDKAMPMIAVAMNHIAS